MKKAVLGLAAAVATLSAGASASLAGGGVHLNFGVYPAYGAPYVHHYYSSYHCKNVFAGYHHEKVWKSHHGYGYGGYGGHYVVIKVPHYKRVCGHYGG